MACGGPRIRWDAAGRRKGSPAGNPDGPKLGDLSPRFQPGMSLRRHRGHPSIPSPPNYPVTVKGEQSWPQIPIFWQLCGGNPALGARRCRRCPQDGNSGPSCPTSPWGHPGRSGSSSWELPEPRARPVGSQFPSRPSRPLVGSAGRAPGAQEKLGWALEGGIAGRAPCPERSAGV